MQETQKIQNDPDLKWVPTREQVAQSRLSAFMKSVGVGGSFQDIWRWSVAEKDNFWSAVWDFCGVIGDKTGPVFKTADRFQDARFFVDAKLNFAENLLRRRDDAPGLIFRGETKVERTVTFAELYDQVSRLVQALKAAGIQKGDRIAGVMPNMPETIMAMLATAAIGAIWSSASPDFGAQGLYDRFGQIEPKVLFAVDGYYYSGRKVDCREKTAELAARLPSLQKVVTISYIGLEPLNPEDDFLENFIAPFTAADIEFERFEFNQPLYIMFSSGTTGIPKCIVHGAGGTLIQHLKEHQLHCDIRRDDRVFYFTTCGWMMWNWLVTALASEATLLLYDGSPFFPSGKAMFDFARKNDCTLFGTSAKYIDALRNYEIKPDALPTVRMITSTGSPLSHENFDYVYDALFPTAHLASISGGTDIVSCFVLGNPLSPVYRGEIQGPGLGMDIDVFDDSGKTMKTEKGELVCKTPFPSMPIKFWNDADGSKYSKAYFERFPGIWCHGDWCEWTPHHGLIIHGRSDATLNPGGVRIGTAEIYRIVERIPEVKESIAVGQDWEGDVRIILFVVMNENTVLDADMTKKIKNAIRDQASPRHVPAKIIPVADIPRTKSNKITELAVREIIHGREVKNAEALANPEALALYENIEELKS